MDESKSYFDGVLLQYIGWSILGALVTIGIYGFWLPIKLKKYCIIPL